jgi:iron complex outermembrane receptor protein
MSYQHIKAVEPVRDVRYDSLYTNDIYLYGKRFKEPLVCDLLLLNPHQLAFQTIGQRLAMSGFNVRSSGHGLLTVAGIRGLYGNQMGLLWEGIPIQSPMNGLKDLSLLPAFFTDHASVLAHAHLATGNNATISGLIDLKSHDPVFSPVQQLQVHGLVGSFGEFMYSGDWRMSQQQWYSRSRFLYKSAKNDYPILGYHPSFRSEQVNNDHLLRSAMQELGYQINAHQVLAMNVWITDANRGLVDNITHPHPADRQKDRVVRAILKHDFHTPKVQSSVKTGAFLEDIIYIPSALPETHNRAVTYFGDANTFLRLHPRFTFKAGLHHSSSVGMSEYYPHHNRLHLSVLHLSWQYMHKKLGLHMDLRQQRWNNQWVLPNPSFSIQREWQNHLTMSAHIGYAIRMPTLNDLFWTPGGNQELQPERGFKSETSFIYNPKRWTCKMQVYHNRLHQMIVWLPGNQSFFQAQNVREVHVTGSEWSLSYRLPVSSHQQWVFNVVKMLHFSTYAQTEKGNEHIIGNQLIFIPVSTGSGYVQWKRKSFDISAIAQYSGQRYIYTDQSQALAPFALMDVHLNYQFNHVHFPVRIGMSIQNITNTSYELQYLRPMPGRSFQLNISLIPYQYEPH